MNLKNNFIKLVIALSIFSISFFQLKKELCSINFLEVFNVLQNKSFFNILSLFLIGCLGIIILSFYDYFLLKPFKEKSIPIVHLLKISWIANSFNALLGFGGLVGASIRYSFYKPYISKKNYKTLKKSISLLMFSTISGVGFLSLLVVSNIFSNSSLINEKPLLKIVLLICAVLFPIYTIFITVKPPIKHLKTLGLQFIFISVMDYLTSGIVMYACMKFLEIKIDFIDMESIFIIATISGIISMIPGGLGSFDIIFLMGITQQLHVEKSLVLLSLVLYRLSYYFFPFLIGLLLSISELQRFIVSFNEKKQITILSKELGTVIFSITKNQINQIIRILVSSLFFISSIFLLIDSLVLFSIYEYLNNFLLFIILPLIICMIFIFIIETKGIFVGSIESFDVLKFSLIILTFLECYILLKYGGFFIVIFLILLWISLFLLKKSLNVSCVKNSLAEKFFVFFVICLISIILINLYSKTSSLEFKSSLLFTFLLIITSSFIVFILRKRARTKLNLEIENKESGKKLLEKYGGHHLSHLLYLKTNKLLVDYNKEVGIIFQETANNIFVLGDPFGNSQHFFEFLQELLFLANNNGKHLIFYQVSTDYLAFYNDLNFKIFKLGEEALIDLDSFSLSGKKKRGLRATINQLDKLNYTFEIIHPPYSENLYNSLKDLSNHWLGTRKEMTFSVGEFEKEYLNQAPIGVLRNVDSNEIIGFLSLMPTYSSKTVSIDLIRWNTQIDIAIMDALYIKIILWAKEEGYKYFNLGMAPFSSSYENNIDWKKNIISSIYSHTQQIYSFKGLRKYKEKYKPIWELKYIIYNDKSLFKTLYSCYKLINNKKYREQSYGNKKGNDCIIKRYLR